MSGFNISQVPNQFKHLLGAALDKVEGKDKPEAPEAPKATEKKKGSDNLQQSKAASEAMLQQREKRSESGELAGPRFNTSGMLQSLHLNNALPNSKGHTETAPAAKGQNKSPVAAANTTQSNSPLPGKPEPLALSGSVGKGGDNQKADVLAVQKTLAHGGFYPKEEIGAPVNTSLISAIEDYQIAHDLKNLDGVIDPGKDTEKLLNDHLKNGVLHNQQSAVNPSLFSASEFDNPAQAEIADTMERMTGSLNEGLSSKEVHMIMLKNHSKANPILKHRMARGLLSGTPESNYVAPDKDLEKAVDVWMDKKNIDPKTTDGKAVRQGMLNFLKGQRHVVSERNGLHDQVKLDETLQLSKQETKAYLDKHPMSMEIEGKVIPHSKVKEIAQHAHDGKAHLAAFELQEALGIRTPGHDEPFNPNAPSVSTGDVKDFMYLLDDSIQQDKLLRKRGGHAEKDPTVTTVKGPLARAISDGRQNYGGDFATTAQANVASALSDWIQYADIGSGKKKMSDCKTSEEFAEYFRSGRGMLLSDPNQKASHRFMSFRLAEMQKDVSKRLEKKYSEYDGATKEKVQEAVKNSIKDEMDMESYRVAKDWVDLNSRPGLRFADWSEDKKKALVHGLNTYLNEEAALAQVEYYEPPEISSPQNIKTLQTLSGKTRAGKTLSQAEQQQAQTIVSDWKKQAVSGLHRKLDEAARQGQLTDEKRAQVLSLELPEIDSAAAMLETYVLDPKAAFNTQRDGAEMNFYGNGHAGAVQELYDQSLQPIQTSSGPVMDPMRAYNNIENEMRKRMADLTFTQTDLLSSFTIPLGMD